MATPPIDGYGASRSGATLARSSVGVPPALAPLAFNRTNPVLWGLLAAIALMAYWYRRVL